MSSELTLADLHIHTTRSDGAATPREAVAAAIRRGLKVIAITDHDRIDGALEASVSEPGSCEVVIGEEITTLDGHVIGLFLSRPVPPGLTAAETVTDIHRQGGLAIAAHPFFHLGGARGVGAGAFGLSWDAIEIENGSPGAWAANRLARKAKASWARAEVGGSDAHIQAAIGSVVTTFPGQNAEDLRRAILSGATCAVRIDRSPLVAARTLGRMVRRRVVRELTRRGTRPGLAGGGRGR